MDSVVHKYRQVGTFVYSLTIVVHSAFLREKQGLIEKPTVETFLAFSMTEAFGWSHHLLVVLFEIHICRGKCHLKCFYYNYFPS